MPQLEGFPGRMTLEAAEQLRADGELVNFAVHPALLPDLVRWLDGRGVDLARIPVGDDPTYIASPRSLGER